MQSEPSWELFKLVADGLLLVMVPFIGALIKTLHKQNLGRFDDLNKRMDHLDGCIDDMKTSDLTAARTELGRPEFDATMARVRLAISEEMASHTAAQVAQLTDITNRIGRNESHMFDGRRRGES